MKMVYYIELIFLDESSFRLQAGRNCSRFQKLYSRCRFMTHMRKNFTDGPIKRPAYKNTHISSPFFFLSPPLSPPPTPASLHLLSLVFFFLLALPQPPVSSHSLSPSTHSLPLLLSPPTPPPTLPTPDGGLG